MDEELQKRLASIDAQIAKTKVASTESNKYKVPITTSKRSSRSTRNTPTIDLSGVEGLEELASKQEYKAPLKEKVFSGLRKVGGILNFTNAVTAGAVKGAINPTLSVADGIRYGVRNRETFGYANILKEDLGIKAETKAEKFAVGTAGFIADVLFDPLTYLTLGVGAGLKLSGRTLTKQGTRLFQNTSKELIDSTTNLLVKKGYTVEQASKIASSRATPIMNDLVQRSFGKKGVTESAARQLIKEGISEGTVNTWKQLGPQLIDKGGIKMFGKTLVSSNTLKNTPVARAAKRLFVDGSGNFTRIGEATNLLKETLGKTFITDFGKNPKLVSIIDQMGRESRKVFEVFVDQNKKLFEGLNDAQMTEFFDQAFKKKKEIITKEG
jgi:hypothetical protein